MSKKTTQPEEGTDMLPERPEALYEEPAFEGRAGSSWEKFRRFAHARKRLLYGILTAAIILSVAGGLTGSVAPHPDRLLTGYLGRLSVSPAQWAYRVGPLTMPSAELRELYTRMAEYRLGPEAAKRARDGRGLERFAREEADTDTLVLYGLKQNSFATAEARQVLLHEFRRAAAEYAVYAELRRQGFADKLRPDLSAETVRKFLRENAALPALRGLRGAEAERAGRVLLAEAHRARLAEELRGRREALLQKLRETQGYQLRQ